MEIDFTKDLTDAQKAYLAENLRKIELGTGKVFFDPKTPLTTTDAGQLMVKYTANGKEIEGRLEDVLQRASKADGADKRFQAAADAMKFKEAHDRFVETVQKGDMPSDEDLNIVAAGIGVTKDALVAGIGGGDDDDGQPAQKGKHSKAAPQPFDMSSPEAQAAMEKFITEKFGSRLLPSQFHGEFLQEGFKKHWEGVLAGQIAKAIQDNPVISKLTKDAGNNTAKKEILAQMTKMYTSTVEQQARGRAIQIAQAGTGDITEEIPGIVKDLVEKTDPAALLARVTPQPINFGVSEPGQLPISVLSGEKVAKVPMGHPDYEANLAKEIGQQLAKEMSGAGAGT